MYNSLAEESAQGSEHTNNMVTPKTKLILLYEIRPSKLHKNTLLIGIEPSTASKALQLSQTNNGEISDALSYSGISSIL